MELSLTNFRCYKHHSVTFPLGVILIDGPSGKGKSTLLSSIKYALYGNLKSVTTFGEKKTSVTLQYQDMTITRTSIPSRLVIKKNDRVYEDGAAQSFLYTIFGSEEQFETTSYMAQKGAATFFSMSESQKLHLLEQLSLLGEHDIQAMKENITKDIKEKRKQTEKLENQIELLESQLGPEPLFVKKNGFSTLSEVRNVIEFLTITQRYWEEERSRCDKELFTYSNLLVKQQEKKQKHEQIKSMLSRIQNEYDQLLIESDKISIPEDKQILYQEYKYNHEKWLVYTTFCKKVEEEKDRFMSWLQTERSVYDRNRNEWLSYEIDLDELEDLQNVYQKHKFWELYKEQEQQLQTQTILFEEWLQHETHKHNEYKKEYDSLRIDPVVLDEYESYLKDNELFLTYKQQMKQVSYLQESLDQWVSHHTELYQRWKKEEEDLRYNTEDEPSYQRTLKHHETYLVYQQALQVAQVQQEQFQQWFTWEKESYERLKEEKDLLFISLEEVNKYEMIIKTHEQWECYNRLLKTLHEKKEFYRQLVDTAISNYNNELSILESKREPCTENIYDIQ